MNSISPEEKWSRKSHKFHHFCRFFSFSFLCSVRRYAVRSRDAVQYSMETDTTFQEIPGSIKDQLVEDRVLLRVYYKAGSYMTYQVEGEVTH